MVWLFYSIEILLSLIIIGLVLIQKGSDGIFARDSKMFGIRSRPNAMARLTYIIAGIFLANTFALIISYQNQYNALLLKDEMKAEKQLVKAVEAEEKEESFNLEKKIEEAKKI